MKHLLSAETAVLPPTRTSCDPIMCIEHLYVKRYGLMVCLLNFKSILKYPSIYYEGQIAPLFKQRGSLGGWIYKNKEFYFITNI